MEPESRAVVLQEVQRELDSTKEWTSNILEELQWTEEHLMQDERVACPHNPKHLIHPASAHKHTDLCPKLEKGYSKEELDKDQSSEFFYEKSQTVTAIKLTPDKLKAILAMCGGDQKELPLSMERYLSDLTAEQRLKIYEFCMESVKAMNKQVSIPEEELMLLEDTKKERGKEEKTYLERIAEERDFKRRRQSYRAKNVHITKKTHTEIIREVILNQMDLLSEMWEEDNNKKSDLKSRSPEMRSDSQRSEGQRSEGQRSREVEDTSQDNQRCEQTRSKDRERSRGQLDRGRRSRSPESRSRPYDEGYKSWDRYRGRRSRSRDRKRSRSRERRRSRSRERHGSRTRDRKSYKSHGKRSRHRSNSKEPEPKPKKTAINLWSVPNKT